MKKLINAASEYNRYMYILYLMQKSTCFSFSVKGRRLEKFNLLLSGRMERIRKRAGKVIREGDFGSPNMNTGHFVQYEKFLLDVSSLGEIRIISESERLLISISKEFSSRHLMVGEKILEEIKIKTFFLPEEIFLGSKKVFPP